MTHYLSLLSESRRRHAHQQPSVRDADNIQRQLWHKLLPVLLDGIVLPQRHLAGAVQSPEFKRRVPAHAEETFDMYESGFAEQGSVGLVVATVDKENSSSSIVSSASLMSVTPYSAHAWHNR